ncbi:MAG: beta strand repeat-containing protein [Candidatus Methylacidiphilales bacterium]
MVLPTSMGVGYVRANPSGGNVQGGSATISSSAPGQVTVNQTSDRAVVNWGSFSINKGETTTFVQPGAKSAVLNRVTGGSASQIDGNLRANGQVYLVNKNGIVVGKSGRVNTAGFTASTHDVANAEFINGGELNFSGTSSASVINQGKIRATAGDVTLIARQVENSGRITARKGSVSLAGGTEVLLKPSGTDGQRVFIKSTSGSGSVVNSGSIRATAAELRAMGGNEYALAVNNSGIIRASSVDKSGGRIVLKAEQPGAGSYKGGGTVQNSGRLIARAGSKAPGKNGGRIDVTGERVNLAVGSLIDASGGTLGKGGEVNIGGGFQGKDTAVSNAKITVVAQGATIKADGGTKGGNVVVWSDEQTGFYGTVSARGPGASPGNGGAVEVSSKNYLDFRGNVDTAGGILLLDPSNILIRNPAPTMGFVSTAGPVLVSNNANSLLSVTDLTNLLASNNITVQTSGAFPGNPGYPDLAFTPNTTGGDIFVFTPLVYDSVHSLTLLAHGDIMTFADILNTYSGPLSGANNASINLVAGWSGGPATFAGVIASPSNYGITSAGSVYINPSGYDGTSAVGSRTGNTNAAGYEVIVWGQSGRGRLGYTSSATGNISVYSRQNTYVLAGYTNPFAYAQIGHGDIGVNGTYSGNISIQSGAQVYLQGSNQPAGFARIGHGGALSEGSANGNITIRAVSEVYLFGGAGENAYAGIGHGSLAFNTPAGTLSGNIDVQGSTIGMNSVGTNALTHIGHSGISSSGQNVSGNITVRATTGYITMISGTGANSYSQIGHGGLGINYTGGITGNISISAAQFVAASAGNGSSSYTQIGHGGAISNMGTLTGKISISAGGALSIIAGNADNSYAQIGHGGLLSNATGTVNGDIGTSAQSVSIQGSSTPGISKAYSMIGNGGLLYQAPLISGNIAISYGSLFAMQGGSNELGFSLLGHTGGQLFMPVQPVLSGDISVTGTGIVIVRGGSSPLPASTDTFAQIGHGGIFSGAKEVRGNIQVSGKDIMVAGGSGYFAYGKIGHSTTQFFANYSGNIDVDFTSSLTVRGGNDPLGFGGSIAQIGHGVLNIAPYPIATTITGNVTLAGGANSRLVVQGGSFASASAVYALIGHGGNMAMYTPTGDAGSVTGDINVTAGSVSLLGGNSPLAFAQIGHNVPYYNFGGIFGFPAGPLQGTSLIGNIAISTTGNFTMAGGPAKGAYVMVGHGGGIPNSYSGSRDGHIVLTIGGETSLVDGSADETSWWIGHITQPGQTYTNADIYFQTNTLDYSTTSTSSISTVNPLFARTISNLVHGNLTLHSTNTEGGLVIAAAAPNADVHSNFALSMLSAGNFTINAPIVNTGTPGGTGSSLLLIAGYDPATGLQSGRPADLIINAAGINFGDDVTLVAGRSIILNGGSSITSGKNFLAVVDNFNANRPDYSADAKFTNHGAVSAKTATVYAVAPELVTLGSISGLGARSVSDIWFDESGSVQGINYKLASYPPPPIIPPVEPELPPTDPTSPNIIPLLSFEENSDDRFRLPKAFNLSKTFTISYIQNPHLSASESARLLWISSFSIVPTETYGQ